jgi:hypothetical protein
MTAGAVCKAALPTMIRGLVALAACHAALAQPAFEPVANDEPQRQIVRQIRDVQSREGVNAEGLISPFTQLAALYEESGDHALALAAVDRALEARYYSKEARSNGPGNDAASSAPQ